MFHDVERPLMDAAGKLYMMLLTRTYDKCDSHKFSEIMASLELAATQVINHIKNDSISERDAISFGFKPRGDQINKDINNDGKWYFVPYYILGSLMIDVFPLICRRLGDSELLEVYKQPNMYRDILHYGYNDGSLYMVQFDEKGYMMKTKEDYEAFEKRKRLMGEEKINLTLKFAQDNNYPALTLNEEIFYSPTGIGYVLPDDVVERLRDDDTIYGHDLTLPIDVIRPIRKAECKDNQYRFVVEFNSDGSLVSREQYKKYMNIRYGEGRSPVKSMVSSSKAKVKPLIRKRTK